MLRHSVPACPERLLYKHTNSQQQPDLDLDLEDISYSTTTTTVVSSAMRKPGKPGSERTRPRKADVDINKKPKKADINKNQKETTKIIKKMRNRRLVK